MARRGMAWQQILKRGLLVALFLLVGIRSGRGRGSPDEMLLCIARTFLKHMERSDMCRVKYFCQKLAIASLAAKRSKESLKIADGSRLRILQFDQDDDFAGVTRLFMDVYNVHKINAENEVNF